MVQFVFVHGVNGPRSNAPGDPGFQKHEAGRIARDHNFRSTTFGGAATVTNALWSIFAAHPAWKLACVPTAVLHAQAPALDGIAAALGGAGAGSPFDPAGTSLVEAARADLDAVLGSLSVANLQAVAGDPAATAKAQAFWVAAAAAAKDPAAQQQLWGAANDQVFLDILSVVAVVPPGQTSLSLGSDLKNAWAKFTGNAINLVNSPAVLAVRNTLTPTIAIFIGDVFTYLKAGGAREQIRNEVLTRLLAAAKAAKVSGEKLVVCGHSMGGVILYDLLSDPSVLAHLSEGLGAPFKVDMLLTVGSQVALFEELKVFSTSSSAYSAAAGNKMIKPPGAGAWLNVFNRLDVLSFLAEPVFQGVEDLEASTIAGVTDAHGAYFTNMVFYARLNASLKTAGILP